MVTALRERHPRAHPHFPWLSLDAPADRAGAEHRFYGRRAVLGGDVGRLW